ncbi:MAG: replication protein C, IncQ-type [Candidatus Thiodiazotropha sp.]
MRRAKTPGTRTRRAIRESIKRLAAIIITAEAGSGRDDPPWALTHLIAGAVCKGRGPVEIALSYRLTRVVACDGSYGRLRMKVWRRLSPTAKVAYHWLVCWYGGADGQREIGVDTLVAHVWGVEGTSSQLRDRRRKLRRALAELPSDEWVIAERAGPNTTILQITRERVNFATAKGDLHHAPFSTAPAGAGAAA